MLYNIKKKKTQSINDCLTCEKFDKKLCKCNGIGEICYEYDPLTETVIDGITKLPIILKEN